jgi:hypothetical protein
MLIVLSFSHVEGIMSGYKWYLYYSWGAFSVKTFLGFPGMCMELLAESAFSIYLKPGPKCCMIETDLGFEK